MTVVNVGGDRRRWEIMLMPGDDPARLTEPDIFWPMMARWLGPEDARLERAAVYTFHSVVQEGWRKGRLLLAGDACHQTPPFLGQGMCAGMRDAANLAWKLAAIVKDGAPDSLLDTYESERLPHVRTFIDLAVTLGAVLQETDRAAAAARDRRFEAGAEMFDFPQPQLGPGCRLDAPPPVGTIFPQPRLADGRLMDEAIGQRFAIVGEAGHARRPPNRCRAAARCRPRLAAHSTASAPPSCGRTATSSRWRATGQELEAATLAVHSLGSSTMAPHDVSWREQGPYDQPRTVLPLSGVPVTSTYLPRQPWTVGHDHALRRRAGPPKWRRRKRPSAARCAN